MAVNVKSSLFLTKHYIIKTYGGSGRMDPRFLDVGSSWNGQPNAAPALSQVIEGWVGRRAGLDDVKTIVEPAGTRTPVCSLLRP
jgi:hypothetical protein